MKQKLQKNILICFLGLWTFTAFAQTAKITGKVSSESDEPLPGVSITVKGTVTGTTSNTDGTYQINANTNNTLIFSFIGYEAKEILVGNKTAINVVLSEGISQLKEVVVVGY